MREGDIAVCRVKSRQNIPGRLRWMTTNVSTATTGTGARTLDPVELYRTMVLARVMKDALKARKTQGKYTVSISYAGLYSVAAVVAALDDQDRLSSYYR